MGDRAGKKVTPRSSRSSSPAGNNKGGDEAWVCKTCSKVFKDENSKILECPRCEGRFCAKCLNMSAAEYKVLSTRSDLHWFCPPCEQKVIANMRVDKEVEKDVKLFLNILKKGLKILRRKLTTTWKQ